MEDQIRINTFQLKPGDSIIMGSDGRDDLEIGHDGSNRVINEDETIFLKVVEESKGNVESIVKNIKKQGSITDDLSLLKVSFFGSPANIENANAEYKASLGKAVALGRLNKLDEAIQILHSLYRAHPDRVEPLRYLGRLQFKQKDYPAAAQTLTNFFEQHQDESGVQYLISRASKKAGDYKAAIDFGERCMLREPEHLNNLINLADAYRLSGNADRARQLVTRAVSLSPDHAAARKLADLMDRS
jgi:tetratricopeptide (TPR) repeat protein